MKSKAARLRELRQELRYHQQMLRVDIRAVRAGKEKCKEIGQKMREVQKESQ